MLGKTAGGLQFWVAFDEFWATLGLWEIVACYFGLLFMDSGLL